jgi:uncharacterized membrane protein
MEIWLVFCALLFFAPLIVSIVVAAQFGKLRASVEELRRRVIELESRKEAPAVKPEPLKRATPPPLPAFLQPPAAPAAAPPIKDFQPVIRQQDVTINWESILGVKLFAWIGGLALFLGVVFFVKYAFENNWITPTMRIVAGAIIGIALVLVGILPAVRRYRVPAQSLCATGILILYADIYSAYSFYSLISLTVASVLMWIVTGAALVLASGLGAQSAAWLGVVGGFLTPVLFATKYDNPIALFGYIGVLNCAIAAVAALKRWNYLILLAAIGSVLIEFGWVAESFSPAPAHMVRIIFLAIEAQFLAICMARRTAKQEENWSIGATVLTGFAALLLGLGKIDNRAGYGWEFVFPMLFLADVGLIALAIVARSSKELAKPLGAMIAITLGLNWFIEWAGLVQMFASDQPFLVITWYVAIFLLFAATPYFCGTKNLWPWIVSAIAGPLQFWFVYRLILARFTDENLGWLPLIFAVPALIGVLYLVKKEDVDLSSGDSRLAVQGAAVLTFVSLVFPVQFEREWITLGWALESLGLILLFRWIPNRRLRAVGLIVACAAFVRLALNPAVLQYHARTRVPIFNWYFYAYGVAAICFFLGARWFGEPREKEYEGNASPLLYSLGGIVLFLLLNIEIADYFSIGPTLTFSFHGNFARDMTYSIAWAVFALGLLVIGVAAKVRGARFAAIGLLCLTLAKLFLHDLASLSQLYRIAAFITVAIIVIAASFVYQRFLSRLAK